MYSNNFGYCHNCRYNRYDKVLERFYCGCEESERYDDTTEYNDYCEEWEGKA